MPLTLADFARLSVQPLQKGVIITWQKESMVMDMLPWEDAGTLNIEFQRTKTPPTPAWRKLNAPFTESKAVTEPIQERVFDIGGMVDIEKMFVRARNKIVDHAAFQMQEYSRAIAYAVNDVFVNGNPETDEDRPVGMWYRLKNLLPAAQSISGGSLDISKGAASLDANENSFIEFVEELIDACDGHTADVIFYNRQIKTRFQAILRKKGLYNQSQDQFGRRVFRYGADGPLLVDLGFTTPDGSTQVIGNVEMATGAALTGGTFTSLYACKWGGGEYLTGFYEYPLDVNPIGLLESGVHYRTVIDWPIGWFMVNPRSIARLYGIHVV